ncbi:MAG: hypothetical protein K9L86_07895 [Candidatus Omnitrophica bacterium]|nr:hypothetical protein [Candidatus Omnitrophota bacterium]
MKSIAKVALPIFLDKEFDYSFSSKLDLKRGVRVLVDFRGRKRIGLVVGLADESRVKKLKDVVDLFDRRPLLREDHFTFAEKLSQFYPYPFEEFLFMMIPAYLKKPQRTDLDYFQSAATKDDSVSKVFIKSAKITDRYQRWRGLVRKALGQGSVMICFPQMTYLLEAEKLIAKDFPGQIKVLHSKKSEKDFFNTWQKSRRKSLILGTRMALFYYPIDLKLIVIEEEDSRHYFQEEKPFYDLREAADLLSESLGVNLVLAGSYPSLATYKSIVDGKTKLGELEENPKDISVVDLGGFSRKKVVGPVLIELLSKVTKANKRSVVLWNKKGFGQIVACSTCGYIYKCIHCSGFLQFSLSTQEGRCPYCHRQVSLPSLCSHCQKGYLKSSGLGIEGIASLLKRVFPEVKIDNWQKHYRDSKITLSTSEILSSLYSSEVFDSGFMLDTDSLLSRPDYRATFDTFLYIKKLSNFFCKSMHVFTRNRQYYLFDYLNYDWRQFYDKELNLRKKMGLPPFKLLAKITLRDKNENLLLKQAEGLYNRFQKSFQEVYGPSKAQPFKLRDKFRYQIIVRTERNLRNRCLVKEIIALLPRTKVQLAAELY